MKKNKKRSLLTVVLSVAALLMLFFLFRGAIYRVAIKYEDGGGRKSYEIKDEKLMSHINQSLPNDEALDQNIDIDAIIDISLEITGDILDFSTEVKDNDPHKTFVEGGANCIGYAAFTAATGEYLIKRFGLDKEWEVKPKKGKLYLFGNNMHKEAKSGWFKDHDFVVFKNKKTKEEIYVDPMVYDSFGVRRVERYSK